MKKKEFQLIKTIYENIYSNEQGFALNLERLYLEKRYQLGLVRHQAKTNFELYAHLPDEANASRQDWNKPRFETRFDFCF